MVGVTGSIPVAPTIQFNGFYSFQLSPRSFAEIRRISRQLLANMASDALGQTHASGNWPKFLRVKKCFSPNDAEKLVETGSNIAEHLVAILFDITSFSLYFFPTIIAMVNGRRKVSLGYRANFFFGAMDGGIDTRKTHDRNFYGPFAIISIGLGG